MCWTRSWPTGFALNGKYYITSTTTTSSTLSMRTRTSTWMRHFSLSPRSAMNSCLNRFCSISNATTMFSAVAKNLWQLNSPYNSRTTKASKKTFWKTTLSLLTSSRKNASSWKMTSTFCALKSKRQGWRKSNICWKSTTNCSKTTKTILNS